MLPVVYGENMFDDLFDNGFFGSHNPLFGKNARNLMKTDIRETDDAKAYRLAVELPGFKKDEISLDLRDGYLTISAEKGLDKDEENKKGRILRQERYAGSCSRSFYVGDVKPEDIKAKYESGVLTVLVPKEDVHKSPFFAPPFVLQCMHPFQSPARGKCGCALRPRTTAEPEQRLECENR